MFFILSVLILLLIIVTIVMFSKINIIVKNIKISSQKINGRYIQDDYQIIFQIALFRIIKIFEITINRDKLKKISSERRLEKIKNKIKKSDIKINKKMLKEIKNLKFEISDLNLIIKLGTEDAALTAILTGILSSLFGIVLKNKIDDDKDNEFKIIPVYINKNLINLKLDCIISFKMLHIIYMLYILNKRKRDDEDVRASDRRTYAYSNE